MIKNKFFLTGIFLIVLTVIYFTFFDSGNTTSSSDMEATVNPEAYAKKFADERREKDDLLRTDAESPFRDKSAFKPLTYFTPDPAYRVVARLEPFADKTQKMVVTLTDGSQETYEKYAHAVFSLGGEACRVLLLKKEDKLHLLFRDATSGRQTYGGGRYVDFDLNEVVENRLLIDFNRAYNPYCAYNHEFACPLPPAENTLPVAVRAGETYTNRE